MSRKTTTALNLGAGLAAKGRSVLLVDAEDPQSDLTTALGWDGDKIEKSLGRLMYLASDSVIIPVQAQYLPARGMTQLMRSVNLVRHHTNEKLEIEGIVMTLVDGRTNLARDVINAIRTNYGMHIRIFDTQIPMAVKAAEASKVGQSIFTYDKDSRPAKAYEALTKEVIADAERKRERDKVSIAR